MIQTNSDNTFTRRTEFITEDIRKNRPEELATGGRSYTITTNFMYQRHVVMLPADKSANSTVLDIGSCYGATGAWCLDNGATHYTGLEIQPAFAEASNKLLSAHFSKDSFDIVCKSFEDFNPDKKFDSVVASGVIYSVLDPFTFVKKLVSLANKEVIIESVHPFDAFRDFGEYKSSDELRITKARNAKIIQVMENKPLMIGDGEHNLSYSGCFPSVGALVTMFKNLGWSYDASMTYFAENEMPDTYSIPKGRRFIARFYPSTANAPVFSEVFNSPTAEKVSWFGNSTSK